MDWTAISTSVRLAGVTSLALILIAPPLAYWIAFTTRRWRFLLEAVVAMPLVLPPTVLGFYLLTAFGPRSPLGAGYERLVGHPLPFTFEALIAASILYSMPFAVQPLAGAFAGVDRRQLEASWLLGVSGMGTFLRVIVPQSLGGLITAFVLSFAHTMGEFGVVLMVGGNIEGVTRTASIDIYDDAQALDYAGANQTALFLLIFSFLILSAVYAINRNPWNRWSHTGPTRCAPATRCGPTSRSVFPTASPSRPDSSLG
jgi:molybdate transport system permease protein